MNSPFDLIIFDCDGTLVDTEYLNNIVNSRLLTALGFPQYTPEYCLMHFAGKTMTGNVVAVEKETGKKLPADFIDQFIAGVTAGMPELLRRIEGVRETLQYCQSRFKMCVASNGERANVVRAIGVAEFTEFFPPAQIFTRHQVKHGKPAPDLFLYAAEQMGASPARTLVIEDSVTGATAGVAAGMTVIGFTGTFHDPAAQERALRAVGTHYVTASFKEIVEIIDRHNAG